MGDDEFSSALSSEVESFENDLDSVEKDLERKDAEIVDDLDQLEDEVTNGLEGLKDENNDLANKLTKIEAQLEHDLELIDLKSEMEHDRLTDDLADLKEGLYAQPAEAGGIEQHVNIDLDLGGVGHMKDDSVSQMFDIFVQMEWWHYLLVGLGVAMFVMAHKCLTNGSQSQDRGGPQGLIP